MVLFSTSTIIQDIAWHLTMCIIFIRFSTFNAQMCIFFLWHNDAFLQSLNPIIFNYVETFSSRIVNDHNVFRSILFIKLQLKKKTILFLFFIKIILISVGKVHTKGISRDKYFSLGNPCIELCACALKIQLCSRAIFAHSNLAVFIRFFILSVFSLLFVVILFLPFFFLCSLHHQFHVYYLSHAFIIWWSSNKLES